MNLSTHELILYYVVVYIPETLNLLNKVFLYFFNTLDIIINIIF